MPWRPDTYAPPKQSGFTGGGGDDGEGGGGLGRSENTHTITRGDVGPPTYLPITTQIKTLSDNRLRSPTSACLPRVLMHKATIVSDLH